MENNPTGVLDELLGLSIGFYSECLHCLVPIHDEGCTSLLLEALCARVVFNYDLLARLRIGVDTDDSLGVIFVVRNHGKWYPLRLRVVIAIPIPCARAPFDIAREFVQVKVVVEVQHVVLGPHEGDVEHNLCEEDRVNACKTVFIERGLLQWGCGSPSAPRWGGLASRSIQ